MSERPASSSPCSCVSMIVKLDPNALQDRQSLFASAEAQAIIEQMTGVSCNGQVILKKAAEAPAEEKPEEKPAAETPPRGKDSLEKKATVLEEKTSAPEGKATAPLVKAADAKKKCSTADVAKQLTAPKMYHNDRTARAIKRWRTFCEKENQKDTKDAPSRTSGEQTSAVPATDSPPAHADSAGATPLDTPADQMGMETGMNREVDSKDDEPKQSRQLSISSRSPPFSPTISRPARARFGRRYSMPLAVITTGATPSTPAGSPRNASPKVSRESSPSRPPSPTHRPFLSAAIAHLQNNREKLSTLFNERSAIISNLDRGRRDSSEAKVMTARLGRRRASDSTESLSEFMQQQRNANRTGKLLQRRGSVGTAHIARATDLQTAVDPTPSPTCHGGPNPSNLRTSGGADAGLKSRSCENVAAQRVHTPYPPAPREFIRGRRGSVCVGQVARAREALPSDSFCISKKPAVTEHCLGPICSTKHGVLTKEDRVQKTYLESLDKDSNSKGLLQRPSNSYIYRRRGSVSTAHIARAREMSQAICRDSHSEDACKNTVDNICVKSEASKSIPQKLTLENVETHNSLLTPFSLQLLSERIASITTPSRELAKSEEPSHSSGSSPRSLLVETANSGQGKKGDEPNREEPGSPHDENVSVSPRANAPKRRIPVPAVQPPNPPTQNHILQLQWKQPLVSRSDCEIKDDVEREILERVAERRRQLRAVRCVSAKAAQRLEARALAQSAAGRLKRNLHEVTKQRKTKELIQIESERRRMMRQVQLIS